MDPSPSRLVITVPSEELATALRDHLDLSGRTDATPALEVPVELLVWDFTGPILTIPTAGDPDAGTTGAVQGAVGSAESTGRPETGPSDTGRIDVGRIDIAVPPYMSPPSLLRSLDGMDVGLVQSQSIGFDGVEAVLDPAIPFANASSVHEASTAELCVGLILASLRNIDGFVQAQHAQRWSHQRTESLADKAVAIIGYGGVGQAIASRLAPFEITCRRIARRARQDHYGPIYGMEELPGMLGDLDVIVLAVPLTASTTRLVDAAFLSKMKRGALLVNVARGSVVDTDALLDALHAGHIRAALDVTDPEPLGADHPLWSAPGVIISPHVGGHSSAMIPRMTALLGRQLLRLSHGLAPINIVLPAQRSDPGSVSAPQH